MLSWWDSIEKVSKFYTYMQISIAVFGLLTASATYFSIKAANRISEMQSEKESKTQQRLESAESANKLLRKELTDKIETSNSQISELTTKAKASEEIIYQEYALLSATGNKKGIKWNGIETNPTPLSDWNKNFVSRRDNKLNCSCSTEATKSCQTIIAKFPQYPFSYYFLAICLKDNNDANWVKQAKIAQRILSKTTIFPNRHSDHDLVLAEINKWLGNNLR